MIDFLATQQGEQHFRITDIIDITGENIAVENDEIGVFADAEGTRIPSATASGTIPETAELKLQGGRQAG